MAQASEYNRQANFRNLQTLNPSQPTPGGKLDDEFNAIKLTTDELRARNRQIQRDDGQLADQSVGRDQLRTEVQVGLNTPRIWRPNFEFLERDTTLVGDKFYLCEVTHLSSATFEADLAAERWTMLADFTLYSQQVLEAGAAAVAAVAAVEAAAGDANESKEAAAAARDSASGHRLVAQNAAGVSTTARDETLPARDETLGYRNEVQALVNDATQLATPADKSVTFAKMADLSAPALIGRATGGVGSPVALTPDQANVLLGNWREVRRASLAGVSAITVDLPDDVNRFEFELIGVTAQTGTAQVSLRCGSAGGPADAGTNDYYGNRLDLTSASPSAPIVQNLFGNGILLLAAASDAYAWATVEGSVGSATSRWSMKSDYVSGETTNIIAGRQYVRRAGVLARKPRLFLASTVAFGNGTIVVKGRP